MNYLIITCFVLIAVNPLGGDALSLSIAKMILGEPLDQTLIDEVDCINIEACFPFCQKADYSASTICPFGLPDQKCRCPIYKAGVSDRRINKPTRPPITTGPTVTLSPENSALCLASNATCIPICARINFAPSSFCPVKRPIVGTNIFCSCVLFGTSTSAPGVPVTKAPTPPPTTTNCICGPTTPAPSG